MFLRERILSHPTKPACTEPSCINQHPALHLTDAPYNSSRMQA